MNTKLWTWSEQQEIRPIDENNAHLFEQIQSEVQNHDLRKLLGFEFFNELFKNIADYTITYDKKFIAYSYVTEEIKKGDKSEMGGSAHNVDLLNISTGATRTIYNYEPSKGQILTLTVSPYKNIIFIADKIKDINVFLLFITT